MKFESVLFACAILVVSHVECAKILGIFPMPGTSHYILSSKLVLGLLNAGHEVTMISPYHMKEVPKKGKYTDVVLEGFFEEFQKHLADNDLFDMQKRGPIQMMQHMTSMFLRYSNDTFYHPNVKKLLKSNQQFDAVIMEQFSNDALKVFSQIYECPLIILSSMGPNAWVNPLVGNPQPVSYVPHLLSGDFSRDLSFRNRAKNLVWYLVDYLTTQLYMLPAHEGIMHQAFPNSGPLYDLYTNVSLILLNSHTSINQAVPVVPNMVEIGGYFIDPPQKLPQDLQQFLDNAKEGVIYFSMGSNLKSKDLPKEKKAILLNVLGKLKEKVLWKFEEDLPDKPSNVLIRKWLPQQDILAHPNIKLFITHGGLLSTTETIYHGVPVLAIPVFGDQSSNADRAVSNGFGLKLEYHSPDFTEKPLANMIRELLSNPRYKENAQRRSKIYHDRPMSPMATAIYWVEYIIRHKGATHLRVAGVKLPWFKYFMVDVLGAIFLVIVGVVLMLKWGLKKLFCRKISIATTSKKTAKKQKSQ